MNRLVFSIQQDFFFLFVLQITAALAVTIFLISFLSYLGYVGELTSAGLFFL